jgi:4-hydroxybenzoate polyprenyltransferase
LRTRPTAYFIILALLSVFLAFKINVLLIPVAVIVACIALTYLYSRRRPIRK